MKVKKLIAAKFYIVYFAAILVLFVWQLAVCGTVSFKTDVFGTSADVKYNIVDSNNLEMDFRVSRQNPDGFIIYNYSSNGLKFSQERIFISIFDTTTQELLQQTEINPANETSSLYVAFERPIPAGTKLKMRLWSKGFKETGPTIFLSKTYANGSILLKNGKLVRRYLGSALCYKQKTYDFLKPVIYFVAEIIIGILLWLAGSKLKMPFYIGRQRVREEKRERSWKKLLLGIALIVVAGMVLWEYIYNYAIAPAIIKGEYQAICTTQDHNKNQIMMRKDEEISQVFCAKAGKLFGVGFWLDADEKKDVAINCKLFDFATGELIFEKVFQVSELNKMTKYVSVTKQTDEEKETLNSYYGFTFPKMLKNSAGKYYKLVLSVKRIGKGNLKLQTSDGDNFPLEKNGQKVNGNLCMMALYNNNIFLKTMFICLALIITLFLIVMYIYLSIRTVPVAKVFLINILLLGFLYCFLIPPYCVPDETAHFDAAYRISNEMLGITEIPGPNRIYKRACDIEGTYYENRDTTVLEYRKLYENLLKAPEDETLQAGYASNTVINVTMLNYLPTAIGFTVARLLHLSHTAMLIIGRLFNLLVMAGLLYIAINKIPFGKSVFAVVCLLPVVLQQLASASYDGLIIAAAHIFIAYCLYIFAEDKISVLDIALTIFSGSILATCKGGVYLPVLGLLLLIPFKKHAFRKKWALGVLLTLSAIFAIFLAQFSTRLVQIFSKPQGTAFRGTDVELYTVSYFIKFPKALMRLYENTIWGMSTNYVYGVLGGSLGILTIHIPWILIIAFLVLLVLCAMKKPEEKQVWCVYSRIYVLFLCVTSVALVLFSMLLAWTGKGEAIIGGVQGRYFLPMLGLTFLLLRNESIVYRNKQESWLVYCAGILNTFVIASVLMIVLR